MSVYRAGPRGQINYVLFSDYPLVKEQVLLSCAMRQRYGLNTVKTNYTCRWPGVTVSTFACKSRVSGSIPVFTMLLSFSICRGIPLTE